MAKDLKALLAKKLAENNERHVLANQAAHFDAGREHTKLALDLIEPNPYQPRKSFPQGELETLANSIQESGLLQPISVRTIDDGRYQLIAGERRLRAHRLLGKATIEAIIISTDDADMAVLALAENMDRSDLSDYEIGRALRQIENLFPSKKRLAEAVGLNREDMYRYFAFEALPEQILLRLDQMPRLLSRSAASDIKRVLQDLDESLGVRLLEQGWKHLEQGEIEQTKLADWIARAANQVDKEPIPSALNLKRELLRAGKKVGSFQRSERGVVIKLNSDALTEIQSEQIELYIQNLISEGV